jgi:hypothetical protein
VSGETGKEVSGWTPDTLKVLEDEKIAALERLTTAEFRRVDEALVAQDRAVVLLNTANQIAQDKFEATVERDSVKQNEFRGALDDLSKTMATRRELEASLAQSNARWAELQTAIGDLRSRLDIGPVGLAQIQTAQTQAVGRAQGISVLAGWIVGGIGLLVALLTLAVLAGKLAAG